LLARRKLGLLLRGQTDDGGVSFLGGIILHVLLAHLPLVPRCESVGDVALDVLFRAGLGVAGGAAFSSVGVLLTMLVVVVVVYLFLVVLLVRDSPKVLNCVSHLLNEKCVMHVFFKKIKGYICKKYI
jgi:hypothetical protein